MPSQEYPPNRFVWGDGSHARLPELLADEGAERVMIVCGENVGLNEALLDKLRTVLGDRLVTIFDGARTNAPIEQIREGIERKGEVNADSLLSLGGGSSIDTAKAISVLEAEADRDVHDLKSRRTDEGELVVPEKPAPKDPVFSIPTTLSAAEVSNGFGVTDYKADEKLVLYDEQIRPKACIYDPEIVATTPAKVIASTGMNALNHGVEILYSDVRAENPFYQATAEKSIELLTNSIVDAVDDQDNTEQLQQTLLGAAMSGIGLTHGVCVTHAINHSVCAQHPISHGDGNSILIKEGIRFNSEVVPERTKRIAQAMEVPVRDRSIDDIVDDVCSRIKTIQDELGVPTTYRDVGLEKDAFERIAEVAVHDPGMASNPREVNESDIVSILDSAW